MIYCINTYHVKPGKIDQYVKEIKDSGVIEIFKNQPGCIYYRVGVSLDEPDTLVFTDVYETREAYEKHRECEAVPVWIEMKNRYVVSAQNDRYDGSTKDN